MTSDNRSSSQLEDSTPNPTNQSHSEDTPELADKHLVRLAKPSENPSRTSDDVEEKALSQRSESYTNVSGHSSIAPQAGGMQSTQLPSTHDAGNASESNKSRDPLQPDGKPKSPSKTATPANMSHSLAQWYLQPKEAESFQLATGPYLDPDKDTCGTIGTATEGDNSPD